MKTYEVSLYAADGDRYRTIHVCAATSPQEAEAAALRAFPGGRDARAFELIGGAA